MVDPNFIFRTGKYANKSYSWVNLHDPKYILWIKENKPKMLKASKPPTPKKEVTSEFSVRIEPNIDFLNEELDERSLEYFEKIKKTNKS